MSGSISRIKSEGKSQLPFAIYLLILFALFIAGGILRFQAIKLVKFHQEMREDYYTMLDFVEKGKIPLLGRSAAGKFPLGPFYYYFLLPPFILSKSIIAPHIYFWIINTLSIPLLFYVLKSFTDDLSSIFATFLFTFSSMAITETVIFSNPSPIPFFSILALGLLKMSLETGGKYLPLLALLIGIMVQFHLTSIFLLIVILVCFAYYRVSVSGRWIFLSMMAFLAVQIPHFIGIIKHTDFVWATSGSITSKLLIPSIASIKDFLRQLENLFIIRRFFTYTTIPLKSFFILGFILILINLASKDKIKDNHLKWGFLIISFFCLPLFFGLFIKFFEIRYTYLILPAFFCIISIPVFWIRTKFKSEVLRKSFDGSILFMILFFLILFPQYRIPESRFLSIFDQQNLANYLANTFNADEKTLQERVFSVGQPEMKLIPEAIDLEKPILPNPDLNENFITACLVFPWDEVPKIISDQFPLIQWKKWGLLKYKTIPDFSIFTDLELNSNKSHDWEKPESMIKDFHPVCFPSYFFPPQKIYSASNLSEYLQPERSKSWLDILFFRNEKRQKNPSPLYVRKVFHWEAEPNFRLMLFLESVREVEKIFLNGKDIDFNMEILEDFNWTNGEMTSNLIRGRNYLAISFKPLFSIPNNAKDYFNFYFIVF